MPSKTAKGERLMVRLILTRYDTQQKQYSAFILSQIRALLERAAPTSQFEEFEIEIIARKREKGYCERGNPYA